MTPPMTGARWRDDIDALMFTAAANDGLCRVHRHAFRTLLRTPPAPADCLAYFAAHADAFQQAATTKVARACLPDGVNFHLTSRDIRRALQK